MWRNRYSTKLWSGKRKWNRNAAGAKAHSPYSGKGKGPLSGCATAYIRAQYNPFDEIVPRPCVPDILSIPSEKRKCSIRGKLSTNAAGMGYIYLNPDLAISNTTGAGDTTEVNVHWLAPVWYSDGATFVGTNFPQTTPLFATGAAVPNTVGIPAYYDNGVDATVLRAAQLGSFRTHDWRCVGAGLRIKYIGEAEKRKGTLVLYNAENNTCYPLGNAAKSETTVLNENHLATQVALTEREHVVLWHPRKPTDYMYQINRVPTLLSGTFEPNFAEGTGMMAIGIFGCPSQEFLFEVDAYYEFIGSAFPNKTKSDCDLIGLSMIQGTLESEISTMPAQAQLGKKYQELGGGRARGTSDPHYTHGWMYDPQTKAYQPTDADPLHAPAGWYATKPTMPPPGYSF